MDSFAHAPESITEIRANRSGKSENWTVRDCLISLLRDIDSGKANPRQIIIVSASPNDKDTAHLVSTSVAGPFSTFECLGVLVKAQHLMLEP